MTSEGIDFTVDGATFRLHVARDEAWTHPRPAVLVCHAFRGQGDNERAWAERLATMGYVGVAHDVYGAGVLGGSVEESQALMRPLLDDRALLGRRLLAGVEAAAAHPSVDAARMAAIGFCFGGLCALDLARRRAPLRGVASFHGLFSRPPEPTGSIDAKVLVMHGYDDPLAPPDAMIGLATELTDAGADWQIHAYGSTVHSFSIPGANAPERGSVYSPRAARRSRETVERFLAELFED